MIQDATVLIGLGLLTFALMAGWAASVAKATGTPMPKRALRIAGAFCAAMTMFLLAVDLLHLSDRLFGWMR